MLYYALLTGHWTSITSPPTFSKKLGFLYQNRRVGMGNDCMLSFTFQIDLLMEKYENFWHFFFKVDFNKYTIQ